MRALLLAGVVAVGWVGSANADPVIFNGLGMDDPFNTVRTAGSAPVGLVTFSIATTVAEIGIYDAMASSGTQTFLIFNDTTGALLYQSAAENFTGNGGTSISQDSYKVSDPLNFTFLPGITYGIGATSSVTTGYYAAYDAVTQNGITVGNDNVNVSGTTLSGSFACCSTGIELFAPSATAVPEPATLALLGLPLAALGLVGMRRRGAAAA